MKVCNIRTLRLGALAAATIAASACAGIVPAGVSREADGFSSQAAPFGAKIQHLGDVVTVLKSSDRYTSMAWDPVDHVLIGTGGGGVKVLIGAKVKLPLPAGASGVAYDATSRTFYFASGNMLLSSKVKGKGVTTLTSAIGSAGALAVDGSGNIYIVDGDHIDKLRGKSLQLPRCPGP